MFEAFLTQPGMGGLLVLVVLASCLAFYGGLVVWIARAGRAHPEVVSAPRPQHLVRHEPEVAHP